MEPAEYWGLLASRIEILFSLVKQDSKHGYKLMFVTQFTAKSLKRVAEKLPT